MGMFTPNGFAVNTAEPFDIENMTFEESAYENPFEAASYLVAESENNYNSIIKAMAMDELTVYESTGVEMVYEAANFKAFFTKVKEFFKKLWEKIKGIFQRFFAQINAVVMKDKDFVKKYRRAVEDAPIKGFEFKGFEFTNLDKDVPNADAVQKDTKSPDEIMGWSEEKIDELVTYKNSRTEDALETLMDEFRGETLVGANKGKVEAGDYAQELYEYFRKGQSAKDTITLTDTMRDKILSEIEGAAKMKKDAEDDLKKMKKAIDDIIKKLESAEKKQAAEKSSKLGSAQINALNATVKVLKDRMDIATLFASAKLKAMKDQNAQNKSICVKLLTYKPKTESAGFVHTEGGSYLDSVVFR